MPPNLTAPEGVARLRETVPAAKLLYREAGVCLSQKTNDLFFGKTLLHVRSPSCISDRTLKLGATQKWGTSDTAHEFSPEVWHRGKDAARNDIALDLREPQSTWLNQDEYVAVKCRCTLR